MADNIVIPLNSSTKIVPYVPLGKMKLYTATQGSKSSSKG